MGAVNWCKELEKEIIEEPVYIEIVTSSRQAWLENAVQEAIKWIEDGWSEEELPYPLQVGVEDILQV